ncbi:RnfH family protein [Psychromonas sp.]|uniref:RnfH family protein n=1 Tax=Psychromonas sp. TaxID=1884585 RepID=UPI003569E887
MKFSVAYAAGSASFWQELESPEPITAEQAIQLSRLLTEFTALDLKKLKIGIFGKVCKKNQEIEEGDRVELYLPVMAIDPDEDDDDDEDF